MIQSTTLTLQHPYQEISDLISRRTNFTRTPTFKAAGVLVRWRVETGDDRRVAAGYCGAGSRHRRYFGATVLDCWVWPPLGKGALGFRIWKWGLGSEDCRTAGLGMGVENFEIRF
ncbi:hypothetical protein Ancab_017478 [Ancistrocladus abbreviatus]